MTPRPLLLALLALLSLTRLAAAGAWVQPEGATFVSVKALTTTTDQYFDDQSRLRQRGGHFTKYELETYLEHGLTARDTVSLKVPLQRLTDSATDQESSGLADLELGWRRLLWQEGATVVSAQMLALVPGGYRLEDAPALGYGRFGLEPSVLVGRGLTLAGRPGYVEGQVGLRWYAGYPSEQVRAMAGTAIALLPWLSPFAALELHHGLGNGEDREVGGQTIVADSRLLKGTLGAMIPVSDAVQFTAAWQQHLWGVRTGHDGGAFVAVWLRF